jgi:uncharacterized protein
VNDAADAPEISIVDQPERDRFEIRVGQEVAGFAEYRRRPGLIAFIHTEIDDRFEGQGLGSRLVTDVLDRSRADALAVLPFCPFVRSFIERHPDYLELVPEDYRERFDLPLTA